MPQPTLPRVNGVILTVGIVSGIDRCEIVLPVCTPGAAVNANDLCKNAVDAFHDDAMGLLADCMASDAYVAFIQGEGMDDGKTPFRVGFVAGTVPGSKTAPATPSNVSSLLVYYEEAADVPVGSRMRVAKNFIPSVSLAELTLDIISSAQQASMLIFATKICNGFNSMGGTTFYRALSKSNLAGINLLRIGRFGPREYVATQRRRLIPHS